MRKNYFLTIAVAIMCSCTSSNVDQLSHLPFKDSKSDKWGLVSPEGKVLVADEYNNCPSDVINDMFFVPVDNGYEMYNISDPYKTVGGKYSEIAYFTNDITPCSKKGEDIKYINKKGEVVYELPSEYTIATRFFRGYSAIIKSEENKTKCDLLNSKMEIIQFPNYSIVDVLYNDVFLVEKISEDEDSDSRNKYLVDRNGNIIETLKGDARYVGYDGKTYIYAEDGYYGLKSIAGDVIMSAKYSLLLYDGDDNILAKNNDDEWGVFDLKGNSIVKCKYEDIGGIQKDLLLVKKDNSWGVIDSKGTRILKFEYKNLHLIPGTNNLIAQKDGDKSAYIIDLKGNIIKECFSIGVEYANHAVFTEVHLSSSSNHASVRSGKR